MKIRSNPLGLLFTALCCFCLTIGTANAAVSHPQLDVQMLGGDSGLSLSGTTLTLDATAFKLILSPGVDLDIPDVPFSLTATYDSTVGIDYFFIGGSLSAGSLLSATFDTLVLSSLGSGFGDIAIDTMTYTGGSLAGGLAGGSMAGVFGGATSVDFSVPFTLTGDFANVSAKLGPVVVPLPAAVWLFGSGLIGLAGFARRRS